jgi:hypothetical protein
VTDLDLVWLHEAARQARAPAPPPRPLGREAGDWQLEPANGGKRVDVASLTVGADGESGDSVRRVALQVSLYSGDGLREIAIWADLPLDPRHEADGTADSVFARFADRPAEAADARDLPLVFTRHGRGAKPPSTCFRRWDWANGGGGRYRRGALLRRCARARTRASKAATTECGRMPPPSKAGSIRKPALRSDCRNSKRSTRSRSSLHRARPGATPRAGATTATRSPTC